MSVLVGEIGCGLIPNSPCCMLYSHVRSTAWTIRQATPCRTGAVRTCGVQEAGLAQRHLHGWHHHILRDLHAGYCGCLAEQIQRKRPGRCDLHALQYWIFCPLLLQKANNAILRVRQSTADKPTPTPSVMEGFTDGVARKPSQQIDLFRQGLCCAKLIGPVLNVSSPLCLHSRPGSLPFSCQIPALSFGCSFSL